MFTLAFPAGAEGIAVSSYPPPSPLSHYNSSVTPASLFPCFLAGPGTLLGNELGFVEWLGNWASTETHVGRGLVSQPGGFVGGQASGPLLLFNSSLPEGGAAVVLAPAGHLRTAILGVVNSSSGGGGCPGPAVLGVGPQGYIPALPPGFSLDVLLSSSQSGIGDAMARWGSAEQAWANTTRLPPAADVVSSHLSYFTDNGAFYSDYYWPQHPEETADDVLVALSAYHRAAGIPVRTYQLDPFWYPRDAAGAMTDWAPIPALFPRGLGPLAAPPYNLSFLLYAAYFSLNASAQRLSNYTWVASEVSSESEGGGERRSPH